MKVTRSTVLHFRDFVSCEHLKKKSNRSNWPQSDSELPLQSESEKGECSPGCIRTGNSHQVSTKPATTPGHPSSGKGTWTAARPEELPWH